MSMSMSLSLSLSLSVPVSVRMSVCMCMRVYFCSLFLQRNVPTQPSQHANGHVARHAWRDNA